MRIRRGGRNDRTLYLQVGDQPDHDHDVFIGSCTTPEAVDLIVAADIIAAPRAPNARYAALKDGVVEAEIRGRRT